MRPYLICQSIVLSLTISTFLGRNSFAFEINLPRFLKYLFPNEQSVNESDQPLFDNYKQYFETATSGWLKEVYKLSSEELLLLERGSGALTRYETRPSDCYKDAAIALRKGCKEVTMDESEKVRYAIRLTKCEIATANIQAPMECQDFDNLTTCVESLSRIPQLWTSYSGYFRDVVSMCFAVRHEIQRDLLESLFQNLTFTQILNSRLLLSHKSQLIALQNATNASLEYILNSYSSLKGYTVDVTSSLTNLTSNVTSLSTSLVAVLKLLTEVGKQQNDTESLIRDLLFITDRLKSDIKDTKENMDSMKMDIVVVEGDIDRAQRNLKTWMENLDAVLTSIERRVPNLGTKLTESLAALDSTLITSAENFMAFANRQGDMLESLLIRTSDILLLQSKIFSELTSTSSSLSSLLSDSINLSTFLKHELSNISLFHSTLSESIYNLSSAVSNTSAEFADLHSSLSFRWIRYLSNFFWGQESIALWIFIGAMYTIFATSIAFILHRKASGRFSAFLIASFGLQITSIAYFRSLNLLISSILCNIAAFFISFFFTARLDTTRQRRFLQNFQQSRLLLDPLEDRGTSQDVWVQQQFNSLRSELSEVRSLLSPRVELVGLRRDTSTNATATKSRLIPKISSNDSIIVWDKPKGLRRSARYLKKS